MIDIPKEFEEDLKDDFKEFFNRVIEDITYLLDDEILLCGNYERETAEMLLSAFEKATIIPSDATNKDTLKVMFPDATFYDERFGYGYIYSDVVRCEENYMLTYDKEWGNAPYKKEVEE